MNYYEALSCGCLPEAELILLKEQEKEYIETLAEDLNELETELVNNMLKKTRKDISSITFHLNTTYSSGITEDDIQRARDYPVTQLVEFNAMGKALAWCHEDKSPSLSYWAKGNNCRCFVCDVSYDSIKILMDRDNYSFIEAVKKLR